MADYDISEAFGRIEDELISSMIRNFDRHRAEETEYGYNWAQWQAEQLKSLERYRRENQKKFGPTFRDLNIQIEQAIREMDRKGGTDAEKEILRQIQAGFTPPGDGTKGVFFKTNQRKLNALVKATTDDMSKAETAILRMANDQYRKAIFNAQVYANSGAGTYEKAVDMATKDMAAAGLNCVEYKNGARHRLEDYADMAIRTANKRAYLYGEGERHQAWGVSTVIVNKRTDACPQCMPFCGKVFIDDVWSGGTAKDGNYPLISEAMAKGLYHPRCRCAHTTYFPGISTANDKWTKEELKAVKRNEAREAKQQYAQRQADKWGRIAETRLDPENEREAKTKASTWEEKSRVLYRLVPKQESYNSNNNISTDSKEYDINELTRKVGTHRRVTEEGYEVIPKALFHKITNPAIKAGAVIGYAEGEYLERLKEKNASAATLGDHIVFRPDATTSDVLEEIFHFWQNRRGDYNMYPHNQRDLLCEIDAKEYLIRMAKKYYIPEREQRETIEMLTWYKNKVLEMKEKGEWYEPGD